MEAGLVLLMAFHVGLLVWGWWLWLWLYAVPMLGALTLLLRAQRRPELHHAELHHAWPRRHGVHQGTNRVDVGERVCGEADCVPMPGRPR